MHEHSYAQARVRGKRLRERALAMDIKAKGSPHSIERAAQIDTSRVLQRMMRDEVMRVPRGRYINLSIRQARVSATISADVHQERMKLVRENWDPTIQTQRQAEAGIWPGYSPTNAITLVEALDYLATPPSA